MVGADVLGEPVSGERPGGDAECPVPAVEDVLLCPLALALALALAPAPALGGSGTLRRLPAGRSTASLVADCRRVTDLIAAQDGLAARCASAPGSQTSTPSTSSPTCPSTRW
ncbi:hypothetical protein ABZT04_24700 [Streptomyces sp. NPDC005492]|uniref:hypothetical protein n=1 Tax=Streptomyces sp. NPDC005492 TaxID=3156883 RepID=UPI0033A7546C